MIDSSIVSTWILIATQGATLLSILVGIYVSLRTHAATHENKAAIENLSSNVNGKMSTLIQTAKELGTAQGRLKEKAKIEATTQHPKDETHG